MRLLVLMHGLSANPPQDDAPASAWARCATPATVRSGGSSWPASALSLPPYLTTY